MLGEQSTGQPDSAVSATDTRSLYFGNKISGDAGNTAGVKIFQLKAEATTMGEHPSKASRRLFLKQGLFLVAVAAGSSLTNAGKAFAQGKASKAAVKYQDQPQGGKACGDCLQFIPGKTPKAAGACKVVEGAISPQGYCLSFTAKK